jgi:hypothetical protein
VAHPAFIVGVADRAIDIETPHGRARAHLSEPAERRGALVLGHGAGGGIEAPDLQMAKDVAIEEGFAVALVEQPYRVAGRRSPAPAHQLDTAWAAVLDHLRSGELAALPLVVGGRSLGARVACRWAAEQRPAGVLCLAFPLEPPQRRTSKEPPPSRLPELEGVEVPVLVVQGTGDQFGMPPAGPRREVAQVPGNHGLKADLPAVGAAVRDWLGRLVL